MDLLCAEHEDSGTLEMPVYGYDDMPGFVHVPAISPLLFVGNMRSAACGKFDAVISTCTPADAEGNAAPQLTTQAVIFDDGEGAETEDEAAHALKCILQGVVAVDKSIREGKRKLSSTTVTGIVQS